MSPFVGSTRWALLAATLASVGWGLVSLFGSSGLVGMSGALGVGLERWWSTDRTSRATNRRLAAAFGTGRSPLPSDADEADRAARVHLGRPSSDRWGPPIVLAALAVACVVVAILRDDLVSGLPAVPLVVCAVLSVVVARRADARAESWLAGRQAER